MKTFIAFLIIIFSGSAFAQDVDTYLEEVSASKSNVENSIDKLPFGTAEHETFRSYFQSLQTFAEDVLNSKRFRRRIDSYANRNGLDQLCEQAFLAEDHWEKLLSNCTKNGFFLCAEEVKKYKEYRANLGKALSTATKEAFFKNPKCITP